MISLSVATVCWLSELTAVDAKAVDSSFQLTPQESQQILNTKRGDDFKLVKAEGVTVQEFMDGVNKNLTNQQMITRHQHPSYDRLRALPFNLVNPTAYELAVGDHLMRQGLTEFTPQQFNATRYLMRTPVPTLEEIKATEYLMSTNPTIIETPTTPTKKQVAATCYLMNTKPCVISSSTTPNKNQLAATLRLQGIPFEIEKPTAKEISAGDHLLSVGFTDFNPQQFAATYYLMNVLVPGKSKPSKDEILATIAIQGQPFNKIAPTVKDLQIAKQLIGIGVSNFTPQQFAAAQYLMANPPQGIQSPTNDHLDATILLQTAQMGDSTITTPDRTQIEIVASGYSPELKKEIAWALQQSFNQENPEMKLSGIAKVTPTSDGATGVHDFEIIWTAPGHEGLGTTIRVNDDHLPSHAFPRLQPDDLVMFTDISSDPDDSSKVIFKNAAQHP
jgi:hypothetical protein